LTEIEICCFRPLWNCWYVVQWVLAKKMFAYKFNSYIVSTNRETKNLQPEHSHRIHSRARQHVNSPIKAPRQWCPSQLLLRIHFLKCHQPKTCDRLRTRYSINLALYVGGVFMMKRKNPLILQSYINLTNACSQSRTSGYVMRRCIGC